MHANLKNDLEAVQEVKRLISEIGDPGRKYLSFCNSSK